MEGKGFPREDTREKVLGRAKYVDDLQFPGMLYARTVHCPYPRARILSVRTERAEKIPGVAGVFTAKDIGGINQQPQDKPMLAADLAQSAGDGVAVAAAETQELADRAAELVEVEYEPLPALLDPVQALSEDAPFILYQQDGLRDNLACEHRVVKGDVEEGFSQADTILCRTYTTQRVQHAAMETDAAVTVPENGGLTVYCPCKFPYHIRDSVAAACGLPQNRVRIVQPAIGGAFGGKDIDIVVLAVRAATVSLHTGRPCKLVWSREECIQEGTKRHPFRLTYKIGLKRDGRITAMRVEGIADAGAYRSRSLATIWRAAVEATGPYEIPHVSVRIRAAFTNHVYSDAVRGFGSPQVDFASESLLDEAAKELQLSPFEIRRRNLLRENSIGATGQVMKGVSLDRCLDRLEQEFPLRAPERTADGKLRLRGIACLHRGESYGAAARDADVAGTDVRAMADGSVSIYTSISEVGQGTHSAMSYVCANVLGIPLERISVCPVDTAFVPDSGATAGSRGTISGGNAVRLAAENLCRVLADGAAPGEKIRFAEGGLYRQDGSLVMRFEQAVAACQAKGLRTEASGLWTAPRTNWDFAAAQGKTYYAFSYGAAGAEIEWDPGTGKIEVTRLLCLHDIGKILNYPEACGQINGGVAMALGFTLLENLEDRGGVLRDRNFDTYLLPTALDLHGLQALPLEEAAAENPLGVHGVGEASTALVAPAIANALASAGIRLRDLPFTLERVFAAGKGEKYEI
jgi:CO/xanthine dehydrogenase Mo-binding subunit